MIRPLHLAFLALAILPLFAVRPAAAEAAASAPCSPWASDDAWPIAEFLHAQLPDTLRLATAACVAIVVDDLEPGTLGSYRPATNTIALDRSLLAGDQRIAATVLAHELRHAEQQLFVQPGDNAAACFEREVDAFAYEADAIIRLGLGYRITSAYLLRNRPDPRELADIYRYQGRPGISRLVYSTPAYWDQCGNYA